MDGAFFDKMSAEWREEQNRCLREIGKRGLTAALRSFIKCCDLDSYVGGAWHGQQVRRDSE